MRFALLGPLTVTDGDRPVPVNGLYLRTTLATLLLDANQPVRIDRLVHALWGERPPRTATAALRNQVMANPHSPSMYRVNGVVRNMDAWYAAFDVKERDALYLPPEKRVKIW